MLHRAGLDRVERIGHVELLQLAGAQARDVEEAIVEREVDVGDERRHRAESLEQRRQIVGGRRLGGNLDHLADPPGAASVAAFAMPHPDRRRQILQAGDDADEAVGLVGIVRGTQLEHHLLLGAEIELLHDAGAVQIPHVQRVAVLAAEQQLRD